MNTTPDPDTFGSTSPIPKALELLHQGIKTLEVHITRLESRIQTVMDGPCQYVTVRPNRENTISPLAKEIEDAFYELHALNERLHGTISRIEL